MKLFQLASAYTSEVDKQEVIKLFIFFCENFLDIVQFLKKNWKLIKGKYYWMFRCDLKIIELEAKQYGKTIGY